MARETFSIIDYCQIDSPFLTEFRRLLHKINTNKKLDELKTVLITSSVLSEGKSTVCSLLSITAAKKNIKTLLVDCDLRRPKLHTLFKQKREKGMTEIIKEGLTVKNAIKNTSLDKLDLITAGRAYANISELFDVKSIGSILSGLKFYYDLIIIDTPPVIPVSDPMLLAGEIDGIILVIKAGDTRRELVNRAVEILSNNENKIIGTVLNDSKESLPGFYSYDNYQYHDDAVVPKTENESKNDSKPRKQSSDIKSTDEKKVRN